ncbi:TRAP transporter small permease [Nitratireductor thuwali]
MQARMLKVARVLGVVSRISLWISATGLVLMTAFIAWQVFGRFVLNNSPTWTEPASLLLMGWFIFLGAAVGIREGYHLSFDVLLYVIPLKAKSVLRTVSDLVVAGFGFGMAWYGADLAMKTWDSTMPSLGLPDGVSLIALSCGGVLIVVFSTERIARRMAGLPTAHFGETELPKD